MAQLNFPDNPINGQLYPNPCPAGVTQYQWDSGTGIWRIVGVATGVVAGTYGNEVTVGQFTVDASGKLTEATNVPIQTATITAKGIVQLTSSLESFSQTEALTARAGKLLQDQIGNLVDCIVPDHANVVAALNDLQRQSTNLQTNALIWCGYYNAEQGQIAFVSKAGFDLGYRIGTRLPVAATKNSGDFFIITTAGNPFAAGDSNAPNVFLPNADWIVSEGNRWVAVNASGGVVKASDVSFVPTTPLTATNVQNAIYQLSQLLRTGVGGATISPDKPPNPYPGQLWWDDDEGIFYIYYTDVNSSQWVELGGGGSSGLGGAGDGTVYEVRTGIGLTGGPITTEGTINLIPAYRDPTNPNDSTIGGVIPDFGFDYDNNSGRVDLRITDDPSGTSSDTALSQKGANILQQEIQAIAGVNVLAGTYNAETGQLVYVTPVAQNKGFVVGFNLPAPSLAIDNYYVIVIRGGDQGPNGRQVSQAGDWYICQAEKGSTPVWFLIDYENITALASNITVTPPIPGITSANDVQRALEAIEVQVQDRLEFVVPTSNGLNIQVSNPAFDSNDGTTLSIGLKSASTGGQGIVQLTSDVTGNSQTLAITQAAANALNTKIDAISGSNVLAGTYDCFTGKVVTVSPAGTAAGFRVGFQAPTANLVPDNYYLIVTISGNFGPPGAPIPSGGVGAGDWFIVQKEPGTAAAWITIDYERVAATASNVSLTPVPGLSATNVQQGIVQLTTRTNQCITNIKSSNNGITVGLALDDNSNATFGLTSTLTLNAATPSDLGGVFIPPNVGLSVTSVGGLSVQPATTTRIGGIIVGNNLTVDANGRLSATGGGGGGTAQSITVAPPIAGIPTATNVYDALTQIESQVTALTGTNILAGTYDAKKGVMVYVTPAGFAKNFRVGVNVPAATTAIDNYYVIVTIGGGAGPTGAQVSQAGDWYICQADGGTKPVWFLIDFENITALASNVSVTPPISGITAARNVQDALTLIERQAQDRIETVTSVTPELTPFIKVTNPDINSYDGLTLSLGLPYASTSGRGIVALTNELTGNSSTIALTQAAGNVLNQKIQALTGGSVLAGTYNATTGKLVSVTPIGSANGFVIGQNCPAPKAAIDNFYVIIITGGKLAPPGTSGPTVSQSGDWYFCEAATGMTPIWLLIDFENRAVDAVNVNLATIPGLSATNVQTGLQQIETQVQDRIGVINNTGAGGLTITTGAASASGKTTSIKMNPASTTDIGGVFVGSAGSGLVLNSSTGSLSLGIASETQLGGIRIGSGLSINPTTGVVDVKAGGTGTVTRVGGTGTVSGLTLTGNVTTAGDLVLGGAIITPTSSNWHQGFLNVRTADGVVQTGRYLDFHTTSSGGPTYDVRLDAAATGTLDIKASGTPCTVTAGTFSGAFSGNGASITALNAGNISTGTLAIARGGTAGTTAAEARNNLLPAQGGNAGKVLGTDGTNVSWVGSTGTASNVSVTPPISGITAAKNVQDALTLIERQAQDRIETVTSVTPELTPFIKVTDPDINSYDGLTLSLGLPYASTSGRGIVALTNELTGNSSTIALTQAAGNVLNQKIQALTGGSVLAGTYNATTGKLVAVTPIGSANGFVVGQNCPTPKAAIDNFYVIIITGGKLAPPGTSGPTVSQSGDWYFCEAATGMTPIWLLIDFENRAVDAVNVNLAPISGLSATNVQTGLQQIETQVQDRIGVINNTGAGGLTITTGAASANGKTTSIKMNPASTTDIGGVFVGSAGSGLVLNSSTGSLSLGIASANQLGGIRIGSGLTINSTTGVVDVTSGGTGTVTRVGGTGTVSGLTLTGNVTTAGDLVLGGAIITPTSSNWFQGFLNVRTDGVVQTGRYLDFHTTSSSGTTYDVRLDAAATGTLDIKASGTPCTVTAGTFSGAFSGNGASITALNASNISTGTLAIARGGTAGTTAAEARNNLLPAQTGNSGKVLGTDGTNVSWVTAGGGGSGTVTSVTVASSVTGLTVTNPTITTNGTITLNVVSPASGNWFNSGYLTVRSADGVVQTGRYLDFHSSASSSTYDARLDAAATGTLNISAGGGTPCIVKSSGGYGVNVASAGFTGGFAKLTGSGYASSESTLTVDGGGIESRPGGGVSDPGFKLNASSQNFYGGLYLNVNNKQVGITANGSATMLFGASLNISQQNMEIRGSLDVTSSAARLQVLGSSGGTASSPLILIQRTSDLVGYVGAYVDNTSTELRYGLSAGTAPGSMASVAYFGPTNANIVGTLQGTTNMVNLSATGTGTFGGKVTGLNFTNAGGQFTVGNAGALACASVTSAGAISGTTITASTDIINSTTKTVAAGSGTACYFDGSNRLVKLSSALRFKQNVEEVARGLEMVLNTRAVTYESVDEDQQVVEGQKGVAKNHGFIADEFVDEYPEMVIWEDGEIFSFRYNHMHAIHHRAIQDLNTKLEAENAQLRSAIDDLIARVEALGG